MNILIIYNSKTGFTKRYATWLAEDLNCKAIRLEDAKNADLNFYDTLIFGSWLHAGNIQKLSWFKQQAPKTAKKIILAVGAMPAGAEMIDQMLQSNFKDDHSEYDAFYLPGGLAYEKMKGADKILMKMFASMMAKKKDMSPEEQEMANALGGSYDLSDRGYLGPVVECVCKKG